MSAAASLADMGFGVHLLEKDSRPGGHVRQWDRLFPSRRKSDEVTGFLSAGLGKVETVFRAEIADIRMNGRFTVVLRNETEINGDALLIATGYDLFEAARKEEYGYGIYDNVITSAELELLFREGKSPLPEGRNPRRIAFVHCVGSRDEKAGNLYCSKVCCVTGVKQAIEVRELYPDAEIFNFYMDLRMFDRHFEEMYFEAQRDHGINFIRGRVSECAENSDGSIVVKLEDTLTARPLKMTVDLLVLLVGMIPSQGTVQLASMLGLETGDDRFLLPSDEHTLSNNTVREGVFLAGTAKGPSCITTTIADGRAAAQQIASYLNRKS